MERQVFLCPLCKAPHDEKLQPGTLQVKCKYCGGLIIVPSRLSGLYAVCPDHPESQPAGLCAGCGRNCCDVCLHDLERTGLPSRYLCPRCTEEALRSVSVVFWVFLATSLALIITALALYPPLAVVGLLVLVLAGAGRVFCSGPVPTIRERRQELDSRIGIP